MNTLRKVLWIVVPLALAIGILWQVGTVGAPTEAQVSYEEPEPFEPELLFEGQRFEMRSRADGCDPDDGARLVFQTDAESQLTFLGLVSAEGRSVFAMPDGEVLRLDPSRPDLETVAEATASRRLDCEAYGRAGALVLLNSAVAGCMRAVCDYLNCRLYGDCRGNQSVRELAGRVDIFCSSAGMQIRAPR